VPAEHGCAGSIVWLTCGGVAFTPVRTVARVLFDVARAERSDMANAAVLFSAACSAVAFEVVTIEYCTVVPVSRWRRATAATDEMDMAEAGTPSVAAIACARLLLAAASKLAEDTPPSVSDELNDVFSVLTKPAGLGVHAAEPADDDAVPGGQTSHACVVAFWKVPAGQGVQAVRSALLKKPAGQAEHEAAPWPLVWPLGQASHVQAVVLANEPAGHTLQLVLLASATLPAAQVEHAVADTWLYVPAWQLRQIHETVSA
jgi:hypothetical protein